MVETRVPAASRISSQPEIRLIGTARDTLSLSDREGFSFLAFLRELADKLHHVRSVGGVMSLDDTWAVHFPRERTLIRTDSYT